MSHTDWRTSGHRTPKTNYPSKIIQFLFWFRECFGVNITMRIDIYGSIEAWVFLIQNVFSVCNLCPYPIRAMMVHRLGQGWQVEWAEEEYWPIGAQHPGHVTSIDQSEASIHSVYPVSPLDIIWHLKTGNTISLVTSVYSGSPQNSLKNKTNYLRLRSKVRQICETSERP